MLAAAGLLLAGCTGGVDLDPEPTAPAPPPPQIATTHDPGETPTLLASNDPVEMALQVSERYFASAHMVILAPHDDEEAVARAASIATAAGAPLLLTGAEGGGLAVETELVRLSTHSALTVGAVDVLEFDVTGLDIVPAPQDPEELGEILGLDLTEVSVAHAAAGAVDDQDSGDAQAEAAEDADSDADEDPPEDPEANGQDGTDQDGADPDGADQDDAVQEDASEDSGSETAEATDTQNEEPGEHGGGAENGETAQDGDAETEDGTDDGEPAPEDGQEQAPADYLEALAGLEPGQVLDLEPAGTETPEEVGQIRPTEPTERLEGQLVLADGAAEQAAAVGIARAAGAQVMLTEEISTNAQVIDASAQAQSILGLGTSFGDDTEFNWRALTAASGVELPGGGQEVFDGKRYVALYGHPRTSRLGVLGEQGTDDTIERAEEYAEDYRELTDDEVVPALEIIVTVATTAAGSDGTYSSAWSPSTFEPLIEAAQEAGQYVVLDFQPGRNSFLDQIRMYEDLLAYPHVGVALDPEWRLTGDQVHLEQIGHVQINEVNDVVDYLADFVRTHDLPQKMLILHQFQRQMIRDRDELDTSRPEVAVVIHADGQGPVDAKFDTWEQIRRDAPEAVAWGWKNFIDEDDPLMSPEETYDVEPQPEFVSYQ
ncbi:MAG TPA: hypothetical protein VK063_02610 [Beutenbergiaceae bacterium]|nr:hypothetical protein [Beutenbergiaceae bacterium]